MTDDAKIKKFLNINYELESQHARARIKLKQRKNTRRNIFLNFIVSLLESKNLHENSIINILIIINRLFKQVHYEVMFEISVKNMTRTFYRVI